MHKKHPQKAASMVISNGRIVSILPPDLTGKRESPVFFRGECQLQAYLASDTGRAALRSVSSGSRIPNLSQANLLKLPVPVLPMEQQREIGTRYRKTARKRLELLRQAELQEEALKDVWEIGKSLEDTCDETDQGKT